MEDICVKKMQVLVTGKQVPLTRKAACDSTLKNFVKGITKHRNFDPGGVRASAIQHSDH